MELMQANREWNTRPADERFLSIPAMIEHFGAQARRSQEVKIDLNLIEARQNPNDHLGLVFRSKNPAIGNSSNPDFAPTNWAFNQLATMAQVPAGYLSTLPAGLAAQCFNHGLSAAKGGLGTAKVYMQKANGPKNLPTIRAVNSENYGRVTNEAILTALYDRFGNGVTGDFRVPGEFGKALTTITKDNTTLFGGDRDMFVFLTDEKNKIEMPNRRDGQAGLLSRGFFVWNSEVGARSFGIATFLFDYVCANRIVWGATEYREVKHRHRGTAAERFLDNVVPAMREMAHSSAKPVTNKIRAAQAQLIGSTEEDVSDFLTRFFAKHHAQRILIAHENAEHRPIRSMWDAATGVTEFAKGIPHQSERLVFEQKAGKILDLVAE